MPTFPSTQKASSLAAAGYNTTTSTSPTNSGVNGNPLNKSLSPKNSNGLNGNYNVSPNSQSLFFKPSTYTSSNYNPSKPSRIVVQNHPMNQHTPSNGNGSTPHSNRPATHHGVRPSRIIQQQMYQRNQNTGFTFNRSQPITSSSYQQRPNTTASSYSPHPLSPQHTRPFTPYRPQHLVNHRAWSATTTLSPRSNTPAHIPYTYHSPAHSHSNTSRHTAAMLASAELLESERRLLYGYLSSPNCLLFSTVKEAVKLNELDLDMLLRAGGSTHQTMQYLSVLDSQYNRRYQSFSELIHAVHTIHEKSHLEKLQVAEYLASSECQLFGPHKSMIQISIHDIDRLYMDTHAMSQTILYLRQLNQTMIQPSSVTHTHTHAYTTRPHPCYTSFNELFNALRECHAEYLITHKNSDNGNAVKGVRSYHQKGTIESPKHAIRGNHHPFSTTQHANHMEGSHINNDSSTDVPNNDTVRNDVHHYPHEEEKSPDPHPHDITSSTTSNTHTYPSRKHHKHSAQYRHMITEPKKLYADRQRLLEYLSSPECTLFHMKRENHETSQDDGVIESTHEQLDSLIYVCDNSVEGCIETLREMGRDESIRRVQNIVELIELTDEYRVRKHEQIRSNRQRLLQYLTSEECHLFDNTDHEVKATASELDMIINYNQASHDEPNHTNHSNMNVDIELTLVWLQELDKGYTRFESVSQLLAYMRNHPFLMPTLPLQQGDDSSSTQQKVKESHSLEEAEGKNDDKGHVDDTLNAGHTGVHDDADRVPVNYDAELSELKAWLLSSECLLFSDSEDESNGLWTHKEIDTLLHTCLDDVHHTLPICKHLNLHGNRCDDMNSLIQQVQQVYSKELRMQQEIVELLNHEYHKLLDATGMNSSRYHSSVNVTAKEVNDMVKHAGASLDTVIHINKLYHDEQTFPSLTHLTTAIKRLHEDSYTSFLQWIDVTRPTPEDRQQIRTFLSSPQCRLFSALPEAPSNLSDKDLNRLIIMCEGGVKCMFYLHQLNDTHIYFTPTNSSIGGIANDIQRVIKQVIEQATTSIQTLVQYLQTIHYPWFTTAASSPSPSHESSTSFTTAQVEELYYHTNAGILTRDYLNHAVESHLTFLSFDTLKDTLKHVHRSHQQMIHSKWLFDRQAPYEGTISMVRSSNSEYHTPTVQQKYMMIQRQFHDTMKTYHHATANTINPLSDHELNEVLHLCHNNVSTVLTYIQYITLYHHTYTNRISTGNRRHLLTCKDWMTYVEELGTQLQSMTPQILQYIQMNGTLLFDTTTTTTSSSSSSSSPSFLLPLMIHQITPDDVYRLCIESGAGILTLQHLQSYVSLQSYKQRNHVKQQGESKVEQRVHSHFNDLIETIKIMHHEYSICEVEQRATIYKYINRLPITSIFQPTLLALNDTSRHPNEEQHESHQHTGNTAATPGATSTSSLSPSSSTPTNSSPSSSHSPIFTSHDVKEILLYCYTAPSAIYHINRLVTQRRVFDDFRHMIHALKNQIQMDCRSEVERFLSSCEFHLLGDNKVSHGMIHPVNTLHQRYSHLKSLHSSSTTTSTDAEGHPQNDHTTVLPQQVDHEPTANINLHSSGSHMPVDSNNTLLLHLYALNTAGQRFRTVKELCDALDYSIASLNSLPFNQYLCIISHLFNPLCTLLHSSSVSTSHADRADSPNHLSHHTITPQDIHSLLHVCNQSVSTVILLLDQLQEEIETQRHSGGNAWVSPYHTVQDLFQQVHDRAPLWLAGRTLLLDKLTDKQCMLFTDPKRLISHVDNSQLTLEDMDRLCSRTKDAHRSMEILNELEAEGQCYESLYQLADAVDAAYQMYIDSLKKKEEIVNVDVTEKENGSVGEGVTRIGGHVQSAAVSTQATTDQHSYTSPPASLVGLAASSIPTGDTITETPGDEQPVSGSINHPSISSTISIATHQVSNITTLAEPVIHDSTDNTTIHSERNTSGSVKKGVVEDSRTGSAKPAEKDLHHVAVNSKQLEQSHDNVASEMPTVHHLNQPAGIVVPTTTSSSSSALPSAAADATTHEQQRDATAANHVKATANQQEQPMQPATTTSISTDPTASHDGASVHQPQADRCSSHDPHSTPSSHTASGNTSTDPPTTPATSISPKHLSASVSKRLEQQPPPELVLQEEVVGKNNQLSIELPDETYNREIRERKRDMRSAANIQRRSKEVSALEREQLLLAIELQKRKTLENRQSLSAATHQINGINAVAVNDTSTSGTVQSSDHSSNSTLSADDVKEVEKVKDVKDGGTDTYGSTQSPSVPPAVTAAAEHPPYPTSTDASTPALPSNPSALLHSIAEHPTDPHSPIHTVQSPDSTITTSTAANTSTNEPITVTDEDRNKLVAYLGECNLFSEVTDNLQVESDDLDQLIVNGKGVDLLIINLKELDHRNQKYTSVPQLWPAIQQLSVIDNTTLAVNQHTTPTVSQADRDRLIQYLGECTLFSDTSELEVTEEDLDAVMVSLGGVENTIGIMKHLDSTNKRYQTLDQLKVDILAHQNSSYHNSMTSPPSSIPIAVPTPVPESSEEDRNTLVAYLGECTIFSNATEDLAVNVEELDQLIHTAQGIDRLIVILKQIDGRGQKSTKFSELLPVVQHEVKQSISTSPSQAEQRQELEESTVPEQSDESSNVIIAYLEDPSCHLFDTIANDLQVSVEELDRLIVMCGGSAERVVELMKTLDSRNVRLNDFHELLPSIKQLLSTSTSTANPPAEADQQVLVEYLSSDTCTLFVNAENGLSIDEEQIVDIIGAAGGVNHTITHLKKLDGVGRKFHTFADLITGMKNAIETSSYLSEQQTNTIVSYLQDDHTNLFADVSGDGLSIDANDLDELVLVANGSGNAITICKQLDGNHRKFQNFKELILAVKAAMSNK